MHQESDKLSKFLVDARIGITFVVLWLSLAVFLFSDAGIGFRSLLAALAYAIFWLLVWSYRVVSLSPFFRRDKVLRSSGRDSVVFWSFEPVAFIVVALLVYSDAPMLARLHISASALERYVHEVKAGKNDMNYEFGHPSRSVGLYSISVTDAMPDGGVQFITASDGLFDAAGFAYHPDGEPPHRGKSSYTHLFGPWWRWKEYF